MELITFINKLKFINKSTKIILGVIALSIIVLVVIIVIAPNYKNDIADESDVMNNSDNHIYGTIYTSRIEQDIDTYTDHAVAIVVGAFTSKGKTVWNSDKTNISTEVYFQVDEVLKGNIKPGLEIKILQAGGELDGQTQIYEGAIKYAPGQTSLLFLGTNEDEDYVVFADDWGQFIVNEDDTVKNFSGKTVSLSDFKSEISQRVE